MSTLKTQLVGRQILTGVTTGMTGGINFTHLTLDPVSIGDRPAVLANIFERFKIAGMTITYKAACPSTFSGNVVIGIHDDDNAATAPTTGDQILNLRVSKQGDVWKDFSLSYRPVDPQKWYYCNANGTTSDSRFISPCTLFIGSTPVLVTLPGNSAGTVTSPPVPSFVVGELTIEYHYVFDGATLVAD